MIKFGVKLGLVAGAAYYVSGQGVWKDSETTIKLYNDIKTNVSPYTKEIAKQLPFEVPNLPKTNEISYLTKYYWNKGVCASFNFLSQIPSYVNDLSNQGYNAIMNNTEITNLFADAPVQKEESKAPK